MDNKDFKFEELKNIFKLSKQERAFHRAALLNFAQNPILDSEAEIVELEQNGEIITPYLDKKIVFKSKWNVHYFVKNHLTVTAFILILFLSTGLAVSAEQSLPNDYLYTMRVKIIEPTKILLASNVEKKTNLRIAFADRALKDYSKVTKTKPINPSDKATLMASLAENVKGANEGILKLAEGSDAPSSLTIANNLQSILSAHSIVLAKIQTLKSELGQPDEISAQVTDSLNSTKEIVVSLTDSIQNTNDTTKLDQTITDQKEEITSSLADINDIKNDNKDEIKSAETDQKNGTIESKLSEINELIVNADKLLASDKKKDAFTLYNEIDQKLGELKSILESEKNLDNVDLLTKTDTEITEDGISKNEIPEAIDDKTATDTPNGIIKEPLKDVPLEKQNT